MVPGSCEGRRGGGCPSGGKGGPLSHCACCEPGAAAAGSVACLPDVPV